MWGALTLCLDGHPEMELTLVFLNGVAVMVLVANKVDLAEERQVATEQATEYAERCEDRIISLTDPPLRVFDLGMSTHTVYWQRSAADGCQAPRPAAVSARRRGVASADGCCTLCEPTLSYPLPCSSPSPSCKCLSDRKKPAYAAQHAYRWSRPGPESDLLTCVAQQRHAVRGVLGKDGGQRRSHLRVRRREADRAQSAAAKRGAAGARRRDSHQLSVDALTLQLRRGW